MEDYVIEMRHISKEFSGVKANRDISLKLVRQEVHALLGENGSGKTALMCILAGSIIPEIGEIDKNNQKLYIKSPRDALDNGIGMVYKNLMLIESFTAIENIVIGVEPTARFKKMNIAQVRADIKKINERYKLNIDLDKKVSLMSMSMKLNVSIAKLLYRNVEVLIFDEPFSYLNPEEAEDFKILLLTLSNEGCSILISSRKVKEIRDIADKCTILKDGNYLGTVTMKEASDKEIEKLMYGREALPPLKRNKPKVGEAILCVRNLSIFSEVKNDDLINKVNFDVRSGEVTCILGTGNSGNIELLYGIGGIIPISNGDVIIRDVDLGKLYEKYKPINGKRYVGSINITNMSVRRRNLAGLSQVPSDKKTYGIISDFDLKENMILQRYFEPEFSRGGILKQKAIKNYSDRLIDEFEIDAYSSEPAGSLSELNKQKLMLAREIDRASRVFIAMKPTIALDYQASMEIRRQLIKRRDSGTAVLLASNDVEEAIKFSDRILVLCNGRFVADVKAEEVTEDKLRMYMSGLIRMKDMKLYSPIISKKVVKVRRKKVKTINKSNLSAEESDGNNVIFKKIIKRKIIHRRVVKIPAAQMALKIKNKELKRMQDELNEKENAKMMRTAEELKKIRMKNLVQFRNKENL